MVCGVDGVGHTGVMRIWVGLCADGGHCVRGVLSDVVGGVDMGRAGLRGYPQQSSQQKNREKEKNREKQKNIGSVSSLWRFPLKFSG